jgi:class 3 adenylate cyclase/tetratricopeptide (TPR) repeat protein
MIAGSQNQRTIDSLKSILKTTKNDTIKFNTLSAITQTFWSINPSEGLGYGYKALELAERMNWRSKICEAYGILGMNNVIISNNDTAIYFLKKSLAIAKELKDARQQALASGALGNVYYFKSNLPMAIDYYLTALKASEKNNDKAVMAACLSNIGAIFIEMEELEKALENFEKALEINKQIGNKINLAINLTNISKIYFEKKEYQLAKSYEIKSLKINEEINEIRGIAGSYCNLGGSYYELKMLDSAVYFVNKATAINKQINDRDALSHSYHLLANIYYEVFDKKQSEVIKNSLKLTPKQYLNLAKMYADSSVMIGKEIDNLERLAEAYEISSKVQMALGNCNDAFEDYKKFVALNDSVHNIEVNNKIIQKSMQYEFDKKEAIAKADQERKEAHARDEKEKSKQQKIILLFGLIIAISFAAWDYRQKKIISKQKKRSDELLLNILPEEVAEELKSKGSAEAQQIDHVTVLFTDFKGFTQISEKLSPKALVAEINECFSAFDGIMEKYGVEKIKTIGDAYMAAGGIPTANKTHAEDVVKAALEIQSFMQAYQTKKKNSNELFLEIRIGIHTGPVVAGIVGVKKFAYDIWGDTVNTASRIESSSEVGKVNISGTTYQLVKNQFKCTYRGKISAKGKGEIDMYFVEA